MTCITTTMWSLIQSQTFWSVKPSELQEAFLRQSITTSRIPAELFQILKDDAVKVLHSICQQIWKTQQWPQSVKSQFSRIFKLPQNCTHFTCQKGNAQNPSSFVSTVCELRISRCTSWIQKMQRNLRSKCQHPDHIKRKKIPEKYLLLLY